MTTPTDTRASPVAAAKRRGLTVRRLGWGVADQAVSSLSNFLLGIFIARTLGVSELGAFSLAFVTYSVVLNGSRGLSTDPLVVRFSGSADTRWRHAVADASGTSLAVGLACGLVCSVCGLVLLGLIAPPAVGLAFVMLGVGLPGLLVQDSYRFAFFSCGRGSRAFINDSVWTALMVASLVAINLLGLTSVWLSLLVFGGTATIAALVGFAQTRIRPRIAGSSGWLRDNRHLGPRYLVENVSASGASQIRAFVLGAFAGLAALGQLRGAEMLVAPFLVVLMGVAQVAVPEARRALQHGGARLVRFCLALGSALAAMALAWGSMILLVFPMGLGELLLGSVWQPAVALVPAIIVSATAACLTVGASSGLRALGQARRSLRTQLTATTLYLVAGCGCAIAWGAPGAAWGAALSGVAAAGIWWISLRRGVREAGAAHASQPPGQLAHD